MNIRSYRNGFTLVELLVVVAIIILLNGILLNNFSSARAKARDSKRVSDIGQLQLTLALYFDRCKQYPNTVPLVTTASNCVVSGITLGTFISQIPKTPAGTDYDYYIDDATTPQDFVLHTTLEYPSDAQKDSMSPSSRPGWATAATCHDVSAPTDLNYCVGSR